MAVMGGENELRRLLSHLPEKQLPGGITGGETKIIWDPENNDEVENARRTFDDLRKKGFAAFAVGLTGKRTEQVNEFDPSLRKLIMAPALRGG